MDINVTFQKSCNLISPNIHLAGRPIPNPLNTENLRKGIKGLNRVIAKVPQSWPSFWMLGKAYQVLCEHEKAFQAFHAAHKIQLTSQLSTTLKGRGLD